MHYDLLHSLVQFLGFGRKASQKGIALGFAVLIHSISMCLCAHNLRHVSVSNCGTRLSADRNERIVFKLLAAQRAATSSQLNCTQTLVARAMTTRQKKQDALSLALRALHGL